jgi:hypothetical protein
LYFVLPLLFISNVYLTDETEDEETNKEYIEETNRDAVMIASAKLVVSSAVPRVCILLNCKDSCYF